VRDRDLFECSPEDCVLRELTFTYVCVHVRTYALLVAFSSIGTLPVTSNLDRNLVTCPILPAATVPHSVILIYACDLSHVCLALPQRKRLWEIRKVFVREIQREEGTGRGRPLEI